MEVYRYSKTIQFWNLQFDLNTLYTKILEVNLFAFAYRLFHEDFSPLDGTLTHFTYKGHVTVLSKLII